MTTHTIGSGKEYATVALWWADCPADLVSTTQTWIGKITGILGVTAETVLNGVTTNATYYPELTADTGQWFAELRGASDPYRWDSGNGGAGLEMTGVGAAGGSMFDWNTNYLRMTNLQLRVNTTIYSEAICRIRGTNSLVKGCILEVGPSYPTGIGVRYDNASGVLVNCLIDVRAVGSTAIHFQSGGTATQISSSTIKYSGASASGLGINVAGGYTYPKVIDTAVFNFSTNFTAGTYGTGSDYNASDSAASAMPGGATGNNLGSLTASDQFESVTDATRDYRAKSTGSLDGAGTRDQTNTGDIDGVNQARSTTTPTIGSYEVVGGGGAVANGGGMLLSSRRNRLTIP